LGIDRIMLALGDPLRSHLDAYLVTETGPDEALRVASLLRGEGIRVDFDIEGRSVKAQFRTAGKLEVPVVLVWRGEGAPVEARTSDQRAELPLEEVSSWLSKQ
jgi:histidyl-tRNA synthetase